MTIKTVKKVYFFCYQYYLLIDNSLNFSNPLSCSLFFVNMIFAYSVNLVCFFLDLGVAGLACLKKKEQLTLLRVAFGGTIIGSSIVYFMTQYAEIINRNVKF